MSAATYRLWTDGCGGMWLPGYVTNDLAVALAWLDNAGRGLAVYRMNPSRFGDLIASTRE